MSEITTYKGVWWLPSNARKKIAGTLEVTSYGDAKLQIDGQLLASQNRNDIFQPIILGRTDQGYITLYRNYLQGSGFRTEGYNYSTYQSQYILTDGHFSDLKVANFNKVTLSYSNLFNWLNQRRGGLIHSDNFLKIDSTPRELNYKVNNDLELEFSIYVNSSGHILNPINITVSEKAVLTIKFKKNKKFNEILDIERQIKNFLRFAITKDISLSGFNLDRPKKGKKRLLPPNKVIQSHKSSTVKENLHPTEMLFNYKDVEDNIQEILINWFSKYEDLLPVYNLYFNAFYSETTVLDQSFLNAIQALEAYHRRIGDIPVIPEDEHKKRLEEIFTAIPKYKKWLKYKLKYSNEPILKDRIDDLLKNFTEIDQVFINDADFSKTITDYRNKLTHYDPETTSEPLDYDDLFKQWNKLRVLLDSCILKELGMSTEKITTLIRRKYIHLFNYLNVRT